jgi:hypothetical protein
MGEDPASSVMDPDWRVHDRPAVRLRRSGLSYLPRCQPDADGVDPLLRAAEQLVKRLRRGEER